MAAALPTSLVTRLARQQAQTVDFATSNVRGSPVPMYIAGAQLLENYPMGPLAGVAFNLTLLSYLGSLDMGLNIDAAAVAEPERLGQAARALVPRPGEGLTEGAAGVRPARARAREVSAVRTSSRRSATSLDDTSSRRIIWPAPDRSR